MAKVKEDNKYSLFAFCRMKRDAGHEPQALAFRLAGNSPSYKHFTPISLLFLMKFHLQHYYNTKIRFVNKFKIFSKKSKKFQFFLLF